MWRLCVLVCLSVSGRVSSQVPEVHLSDIEYNQLPKLFTLEHYGECLVQPDSAFCLASFDLTSPKPSQLYDTMKTISQYERFNYNHTKLHRGVCITKSCKKFLTSPSRELDALVPAFEACVNESVNEEYGFEAKVDELLYCKRNGETRTRTWQDYLFLVVVVILLLLNLSGTLYDLYIRKPNVPGIPWLMAFSIRISWEQITIIRNENEGDPRLHRLSPIQGVRVLTMFLVLMSHVCVVGMYRVPPDNPRFIELVPYTILSAILFNGHFIMQTYMVMASFLVSYNFLIFRETKKRFTWRYLWEAIIQRFLRLTPAYMFVISLTACWSSYISSGPLCPLLEEEGETCRDKWWLHLFYVHNIFKASDICLPQSWYLGADFQLFIIGMTILMIIWRYPSITRPLLIGAMIVATATQFCLIYFLKLRPPILMQSPEKVRNLFKNEPSFWLIHTSFQGNLQGYILGLILGIAYYKWEKEDFRIYEKKWFRILHIISVPVGFSLVLAGHPILSMKENYLYLALYGMIDRLSFALNMSIVLLGLFYRIDTIYLRILNWRGWQAMGRLSYSVMLLHTGAFMNISCTSMYPHAFNLYSSTNDWFGNLAISYLLAVPLAVLVEYPLQRLQKVLTQPPANKNKKEVNETNGKKKEVNETNGKKKEVYSTNGKKKEVYETNGRKNEVYETNGRKNEVYETNGKKMEVYENNGKKNE